MTYNFLKAIKMFSNFLHFIIITSSQETDNQSQTKVHNTSKNSLNQHTRRTSKKKILECTTTYPYHTLTHYHHRHPPVRQPSRQNSTLAPTNTNTTLQPSKNKGAQPLKPVCKPSCKEHQATPHSEATVVAAQGKQSRPHKERRLRSL
jgi:hypothetical protein